MRSFDNQVFYNIKKDINLVFSPALLSQLAKDSEQLSPVLTKENGKILKINTIIGTFIV